MLSFQTACKGLNRLTIYRVVPTLRLDINQFQPEPILTNYAVDALITGFAKMYPICN